MFCNALQGGVILRFRSHYMWRCNSGCEVVGAWLHRDVIPLCSCKVTQLMFVVFYCQEWTHNAALICCCFLSHHRINRSSCITLCFSQGPPVCPCLFTPHRTWREPSGGEKTRFLNETAAADKREYAHTTKWGGCGHKGLHGKHQKWHDGFSAGGGGIMAPLTGLLLFRCKQARLENLKKTQTKNIGCPSSPALVPSLPPKWALLRRPSPPPSAFSSPFPVSFLHLTTDRRQLPRR